MVKQQHVVKRGVSPARHPSLLAGLVPILPHDAVLSETAGDGVRKGRGKIPGRLLDDGTWVGYRDWTALRATQAHVAAWGRWGAGIGVQGRVAPGVDVDIDDEDLAARVEALACEVLGLAPVRVGRWPRRLLAYRWKDGVSGLTWRAVRLGEAGVVELRGDGQQWVAEGVHPGTGKDYQWLGGWGDDALEEISPEDVDRFFARLVTDLGGTDAGGGGMGVAERRRLDWPGFKAADDLLVIDALRVLPNDYGYDEWVRLTAAVKAAARDPEGVYEAFEAWSLRRDDGRCSPEETRAKWDVIADSSVGAETLFGEVRARVGDWCEDARWDFEPVARVVETEEAGAETPGDLSDGEAILHRLDVFRDFVWVEERACFYRRGARELVAAPTFNARFACPAMPWGSATKCATAVFMNSGRGRRAARVDYLVGAGEDAGGVLNLWQPPRVAPGNSAGWGGRVLEAHLEYLVPDTASREALTAWLAHFVQHPDDRPAWGVLLQGGQGTGKSAIAHMLERWLAQGAAQSVSSHLLRSSFNGWASCRQLVYCQETKGVREHDYNELKSLITDDKVAIHRKGKDPVVERNAVRVLLLSNYDNAMWLDEDDRRFLVVRCADTPHVEGAAYYERLFGVLDQDDRLAEALGWLGALDIGGWNFRERAPMTAAKEEMAAATRGDMEVWVREAVEGRVAPFDRPVFTPMLDAIGLPSRALGPNGGRQALGRALKAAGCVGVRYRRGGALGTGGAQFRAVVMPWAAEALARLRAVNSEAAAVTALIQAGDERAFARTDARTDAGTDGDDGVTWVLRRAEEIIAERPSADVIEFPQRE
jgi:hypothetical protein